MFAQKMWAIPFCSVYILRFEGTSTEPMCSKKVIIYLVNIYQLHKIKYVPQSYSSVTETF